MQSKFKYAVLFLIFGIGLPGGGWDARAAVWEDEIEEDFVTTAVTGVAADDDGDDVDDARAASAAAVAEYQIEGSLFEQITSLEQEKVLMQLEKERAQLDLELDKLAAEKIRLHMEIDTLSGRAEQQQQEIETEKAKLEAEAARLAREKENLAKAETETTVRTTASAVSNAIQKDKGKIADSYKLINVFGAGNQLQATVSDLATGQSKKLTVGKTLAGYTVKSISLDEGVVFVKDGETENLNVTSGK